MSALGRNGKAPLWWTVSYSPQCPLFELDGTEVPEVTMSALAIVKALDIVEYVSSGLISSAIVTAIDPLALQQGKEALYGSIVIAVAAGTHAALDTVLLEQCLIVIT